jgi:hypothetical protein
LGISKEWTPGDCQKIGYMGRLWEGSGASVGTGLLFRKVAKVDLQKVEISVKEWQRLAKNKFKWRSRVTVQGKVSS